jgi:hypothetical protein
MAVRQLQERGVKTRKAQAAALGMGMTSFMEKLRDAGVTKSQVSHGKWIPFRNVSNAHRTVEYRYLTILSQAAQKIETPHQFLLTTAIHWANEWIESGKDITYVRNSEAGWKFVPADESNWYLKRLRDAAREFIAPTPPLD